MVIEEGFKDVVKKAATGIKQAQRYYNYLSGKSDHPYNFAETAPWSVINATDWKPYKKDGTKFTAMMDRDAGKVLITIDAEHVGPKAAEKLNPKSTDKSLLKYMKKYDKSKKEITLILPITDKDMIKRLKDEEDFGKYNKDNKSNDKNGDQIDKSNDKNGDQADKSNAPKENTVESIDLPLRIKSGNNNSSIKFI